MRFFRYLFPLFTLTFIAVYGQRVGQETTFNRELRSRDDQGVREFVDSKENIPVKEKAKNLEISGDVRFEYTNLREKGVVLFVDKGGSDYSSGYRELPPGNVTINKNGRAEQKNSKGVVTPLNIYEKYRNLRGGHYVDIDGLPVSHNDFDVEFNLKLKYVYENAWANAQLQFDNPCGIKRGFGCSEKFPIFNRDGSRVFRADSDTRITAKGSGEQNLLSLKRAFIGYNLWADGKNRFDIEVGRRKLSDVFDSEIQFTARFDGMLVKYATSIGEISDFYWNTGAFVIDERKNHFGWVTEFGFLNVFDTGLDLKYSFIDWRKFGVNRCFARNPWGAAFANSQITAEYNFSTPEIFCKTYPAQLYAGFLVNQAANKSKFTHKRENLGAFAGFYIGEVNKKGDWMVDIEYIYVQAQAIPDFDVGSIGRGNIIDENFYEIYQIDAYSDSNYDSSGDVYSSSGGLIGYFPRRGNANFHGWRIDTLYAITDNLSIELEFETSTEITRKLGGPHKYADFEIEVIYAF